MNHFEAGSNHRQCLNIAGPRSEQAMSPMNDSTSSWLGWSLILLLALYCWSGNLIAQQEKAAVESGAGEPSALGVLPVTPIEPAPAQKPSVETARQKAPEELDRKSVV